MTQIVLWLLGSYLLGSLPTAYILVRLFSGKDVREVGSGNVGSTNATRAAGRGVGVLVFLVDALKGFLPVWLAGRFCSPWLVSACGIFVLAGHMWPVWLRFRGGKGVATTFGLGMAVAPVLAVVCISAWAVLVLLTGYISLSSCVAIFMAAVFSLTMSLPWQYVVMLFLISTLVSVRHRSNFIKIRNGVENRSPFWLFRKK